MKVADLRARAGFTMIELLVVIAIIGVLAVAVLSSINPLEQIRKGQDTRRRSDAAQVLNAVDRYYATEEEWPWGAGLGSAYDGDLVLIEDGDVDVLATQDEIKGGFAARIKVATATDPEDSVYLFWTDSPSETLYSCFIAKSKAFKDDACDADGAHDFLSTFCTDGAPEDYYICLP